MSGGMGTSGMAISGGPKKVADLFKHGRGPDRQKRRPRNSVKAVVTSRPSGKTWQGRDV